MTRAALIDERGAVINVIVAYPEEDSIPGCTLIEIPEGEAIDTRWVWNEADGFKPGPELQAELDAEAAEIEAEGLAFDD